MGGTMRIVTVKEVADFLRLKEATVCRLAAEGKLPGVKVGKSWRFDMDALERCVTCAQPGMIEQSGRGERGEKQVGHNER
jgi:excisionase family DNA binding protein